MSIGCLLCVAVLGQTQATAKPWAQIVSAARAQVGVTTSYDPTYVRLDFPGGDVPQNTGVCTDVIIRALRVATKVDLQREIYLDKSANREAYGGGKPDRSIDHRRVKDQIVYLKRQRKSISSGSTLRPGDFVTWELPNRRLHIGIVSDRKSRKGVPLIIHNISRGAVEEDVLNAWNRTGAYRWETG